MNSYKCRQEIRKYFSENDIRFLEELARIAGKYHAENIHSRIGYEVLGPALLGYTSWLHGEAVKSGAGMIVFLAREGKILKRAYDQLFSQENIRTVYINVSRISLCRASVVYTKSLDDILRLFTNTVLRSRSKVSQMFELLGIPKCADEYPDSERQIAEISDTQELYTLIMRKGMTYFYTQNMLLKKYLADNGIAGGTVILSDIGYAGTMQALLGNIIPYVRSVGCYVISSEYSRYKRNFMFRRPEIYGYWNSDKEAWADAGYYFSRLTSYFETLFLSAEGTTTEYVEITNGGGGHRTG